MFYLKILSNACIPSAVIKFVFFLYIIFTKLDIIQIIEINHYLKKTIWNWLKKWTCKIKILILSYAWFCNPNIIVSFTNKEIAEYKSVCTGNNFFPHCKYVCLSIISTISNNSNNVLVI